MASRFGFASLIPLGLTVDTVVDDDGVLVVTARSSAGTATCPLCGTASHQVQSRYIRQPADLPYAGRRMHLRLLVRRFRCAVQNCQRKVFAERFATGVLAERARRTGRLDTLVHHLGLALAGGLVPSSLGGSCCRSATTRYFEWYVGMLCRTPSHWLSSVGC